MRLCTYLYSPQLIAPLLLTCASQYGCATSYQSTLPGRLENTWLRLHSLLLSRNGIDVKKNSSFVSASSLLRYFLRTTPSCSYFYIPTCWTAQWRYCKYVNTNITLVYVPYIIEAYLGYQRTDAAESVLHSSILHTHNTRKQCSTERVQVQTNRCIR